MLPAARRERLGAGGSQQSDQRATDERTQDAADAGVVAARMVVRNRAMGRHARLYHPERLPGHCSVAADRCPLSYYCCFGDATIETSSNQIDPEMNSSDAERAVCCN